MPPKRTSKAAKSAAEADPGQQALLDLIRAVDATEAGILNLSVGVTDDEADALWKVYDTNGDGWLSREEVGKLVADLATSSKSKLETTIAAVAAALESPTSSGAMFAAFDTSGDGKIDKGEFMQLAMKGVNLLQTIGVEEADKAPKRPKRGASAAAIPPPQEPALSALDVLLRASSIKSGIQHLAEGVTEPEAETLWNYFDADGSGEIDTAELASLFAEQAKVIIQFLQKQVDAISEAVDSAETVDTIFKRFDTSEDGKVQKEEFVALAKAGCKIDAK